VSKSPDWSGLFFFSLPLSFQERGIMGVWLINSLKIEQIGAERRLWFIMLARG
jgi:hypothetical protein